MKNIKLFIIIGMMGFISACELDGLQDSPNAITPEQIDPDLLLNGIQFGVNEMFFEHTDYAGELARHLAVEPRGATYETAWQPVDFDDMWEQAYAGILKDCALMIELGNAGSLFTHVGIAKVTQAYTLMVLVDFFGDVPWDQALQGAANFNPGLTAGATVYAEAQRLLTEAIADFAAEELALPASDVFYGGDDAAWTRLANTLLLKSYMATRLVSDNNTAIAAYAADQTQLIQAGESFTYPFSTNGVNPDSRHPYFGDNYLNGANDYQNNYFMGLVVNGNANGKALGDPRARYYFYRQETTLSNDVNERPCSQETLPTHYPAGMPWCGVGGPDGDYWGRDHLDTDGIPPDNLLRTIHGLYPVGGRWDATDDTPASASDGAQGAGFHPIFMESWVHFLLAEWYLMEQNDVASASAELGIAVTNQLAEVRNFSMSSAEAETITTWETAAAFDWATTAATYAATVVANFNAAATVADQMNIIGTEYYVATWGNGLEAYNSLRRTGTPNDMQLALDPNPGDFGYSFKYPSNFIDRNSTVDAKASVAVKVFWDNNPANFLR